MRYALGLSNFAKFNGFCYDEIGKHPIVKTVLARGTGLDIASSKQGTSFITFAGLRAERIQGGIEKNGLFRNASSEVVVNLIYQAWETIIRNELKKIAQREISSSVFGDLRIIRNALQHSKFRQDQFDGLAKLEVFLWFKDQIQTVVEEEMLNAILYAISAEAIRLNRSLGNEKAKIESIPYLRKGNRAHYLAELGKDDFRLLKRCAFYSKYIASQKSLIRKIEMDASLPVEH